MNLRILFLMLCSMPIIAAITTYIIKVSSIGILPAIACSLGVWVVMIVVSVAIVLIIAALSYDKDNTLTTS